MKLKLKEFIVPTFFIVFLASYVIQLRGLGFFSRIFPTSLSIILGILLILIIFLEIKKGKTEINSTGGVLKSQKPLSVKKEKTINIFRNKLFIWIVLYLLVIFLISIWGSLLVPVIFFLLFSFFLFGFHSPVKMVTVAIVSSLFVHYLFGFWLNVPF